MRPPTLDNFVAFLAIAEHRSFRRAALALGVSPSALTHTMRALEDRVGVRLLNRTTRSVALSEAGTRLADRLRPAMAIISDALGEVAENGDRLNGRISINAMEYGAQLLVERAIGPFQELYPDVSFEIVADPALVDLVAAGFDAGVRFRDQVPSDMIAVPIAPPAAMVAVASPSYLNGRSTPVEPADLLGHRCIRQRLTTGAIYRWEFQCRGRTVLINPPGSITLNSINVIVRAALSGLGIAFTPLHYVNDHLREGQLVQLLRDHSLPFDGHCFYYPSARHPTRTFATFVQHLRTQSASRID